MSVRFWTILVALLFPPFAFAVATSPITYHGRILAPDGSAEQDPAVQFKIQIRSPGSENCLMYEETQTLNMAGTSGAFSLTINGATSARTDGSGFSIEQIMGNHGTFMFAGGGCSIGTTYTPTSIDGRAFQVFFKDSTMPSFDSFPTQAINLVPKAIDAEQVAGFPASSLLRVDNAGVPGAAAPFSTAQFTALQALINGSSAQYVPAGSTGAGLPAFAADPVGPIAGDLWYDSTGHIVKYFDGTSVQTFGVGGGSVSSITAGTGLTGGTISTTGTIALSNVGAAGTYTKVTTDAQGRVTAGSQITGADITSGTIAGTTSMNSSGNVQVTNVSSTTNSTNNLRIFENTNAHKVTVTAPAALAVDYGLTLPTALPGVSGYVLASTTAGILSWANPLAGIAAGNINSFAYVNGGNSFGGPATLGTNDANTLSLQTNGTPRITVDTTGHVGIGTTSPMAGLHVNKDAAASTPGLRLDGNWFYSGGDSTTTKPHLLIEPAGTPSNNWNPNGTAFGINAPSGWWSQFANFQVNGATKIAILINDIQMWHGDSFLTSGAGKLVLRGYSAPGGYNVDMIEQAGNNGSTTNGSDNGHVIVEGGFATASGSATYNGIQIASTINQTGTANGVTRGIYVNPTLTTATDYRALETVRGNVILGSASGNVGIGTTTPATALDLNGAISLRGMAAPTSSPAGQGRIYFDSTSHHFMVSENNGGYATLATSGGSAGGQSSTSALTFNSDSDNSGSDGGFHFQKNGTDLLTVTNSGTVGIGNSTPWGAVKLDVEGDEYVSGHLRLSFDGGASAAQAYFDGTNMAFGSPAGYVFESNGGLIDQITSSGAIAIGTTNPPLSKVDINGGVAIGSYATNNAAPSNGLIVSGNVGIGTTNPQAKLHVNGPVWTNNSDLRLDTSGGSSNIANFAMSQVFVFSNHNSAPVDLNPAFKFNVTSSETTALTITDNGNVGIGTTAPTAPLEVNGNALVDGTLSVASTVPFAPSTWTNSTVTAITGTRNYIGLNNNVEARGTLSVGTPFYANDLGNAILYVNGNVGIGTSTASSNLSFSGQSSQSVGMEREVTASTAGKDLVITAGGAAAGGTDLHGGNLVLNSGMSTGQGGSDIVFNLAMGAQGPGTTDRPPINEFGRIRGDSRGVQFIDGTASGLFAVALGWGGVASGTKSMAYGNNTNASGNVSAASGDTTTAESYAQTTIGSYNLPLGTETPGSWVITDPLFVIGNGTGSGAGRSNALTVLKNGKVGIGTTTPATALDLNGALSARGMAAPALSPAGQGRIYYDSTLNTFQVSQNNGAYTNLVTTSGTQSFSSDITMSGAGTGLAVTNNETVGGTLGVTGAASVNGGLTMGGASFNDIFYGTNGVAAPGNASTGEKIQLYGTAGTVASTDFALGVEGSYLWYNSNGGYKWYKNSSLQMMMDTSGNLGIGPTAPNFLLDVTGGNFHLQNLNSGALGPRIILDNTAGNGQGSLDFYTVSGANPNVANPSVRWWAVDDGNFSGNMYFQNRIPGGSNTLVTNLAILSNGNVGIGTTTPGYPLDVNGTVHVGGSYIYGSGTANIKLGPGGLMAFNVNGNPTMGSQGSAQRFDFSSQGGIGWSNNAGGFNSGSIDTGISRGSAGRVYLGNGTPNDYSGTLIATNVGIGTTAPNASLDLGAKTDATVMQSGTTAQRPASPLNGMFRYNTDLQNFEGYANGHWVVVLTNPYPVAPPAGTGGTGYFVITSGTTNGNIGGLAGANTFCRTDLNTNAWMNKPGSLNTSKVFALMCDGSSCQNPTPNANFYFAVSGDASIGGAVFVTDAFGTGPGDFNALTSMDRFGGSAANYWQGNRAWGEPSWAPDVESGAPGYACNNWTDATPGNIAGKGIPAMTGYARFSMQDADCSSQLHLICFVNP